MAGIVDPRGIEPLRHPNGCSADDYRRDGPSTAEAVPSRMRALSPAALVSTLGIYYTTNFVRWSTAIVIPGDPCERGESWEVDGPYDPYTLFYTGPTLRARPRARRGSLVAEPWLQWFAPIKGRVPTILPSEPSLQGGTHEVGGNLHSPPTAVRENLS